jgi:hypothetical protein
MEAPTAATGSTDAARDKRGKKKKQKRAKDFFLQKKTIGRNSKRAHFIYY